MIYTDDPVMDAENYYNNLDSESLREEEKEYKRLDLDDIINNIEKQYGYPMEEFDYYELSDVVFKSTGYYPKDVREDISNLSICYI